MTNHEGAKIPRSKAKLAAEIGGAVGASIVIGAAGYGLYSRHRSRQRETFATPSVADFEKALSIFDEPRLGDHVKTLMAELAVRIYYASDMTLDPIINQDTLLDMLERDYGAKTKFKDEHGFELGYTVLKDAIGYLRDYGLVDLAHREANPQSYGYIASPALRWGFEGDAINDFLAQAENRYIQLHPNLA